jgi:hypothetical protein
LAVGDWLPFPLITKSYQIVSARVWQDKRVVLAMLCVIMEEDAAV